MKNKLMMFAMALVAMSQTMNAALMTERDAAIQRISMSNGSGRTLAPKIAKAALFDGAFKRYQAEVAKAHYLLSLQPKPVFGPQEKLAVKTSYAAKAFKFAKNPKAIAAGLVGSGLGVYACKSGDQVAQPNIAEFVQNAVLSEAVKKDEPVSPAKNVEFSRFERLQNALNQFAKSTKSTIQDHPYVSGTVAVAAVGGLGYLAYKKYTTPKTVQAAKITPVVAAPAHVVKKHAKGKGVKHYTKRAVFGNRK